MRVRVPPVTAVEAVRSSMAEQPRLLGLRATHRGFAPSATEAEAISCWCNGQHTTLRMSQSRFESSVGGNVVSPFESGRASGGVPNSGGLPGGWSAPPREPNRMGGSLSPNVRGICRCATGASRRSSEAERHPPEVGVGGSTPPDEAAGGCGFDSRRLPLGGGRSSMARAPAPGGHPSRTPRVPSPRKVRMGGRPHAVQAQVAEHRTGSAEDAGSTPASGSGDTADKALARERLSGRKPGWEASG